MSRERKGLTLTLLLFSTLSLAACSSLERPKNISHQMLAEKSEIVQTPVLVVPEHRMKVRDDSRIVIADITGYCAHEVRDALARRLIDNPDYSVLTRVHLQQIIAETDESWAGRFNTETAAKLGRLMGASLWIVGHVSYCGQTFYGSTKPGDRSDLSILAVIQIIDLDTGRVVVSSAGEGRYSPQSIASLDLESQRLLGSATEWSQPHTTDPDFNTPYEPSYVSPAGTPDPRADPSDPPDPRSSTLAIQEPNPSQAREEPADEGFFANLLPAPMRDNFALASNKIANVFSDDRKEKALQFVMMKAADDLANSFADKFFARPTWETVELWNHPRWSYGNAVRLIKLGHCKEAVELLKTESSQDLLQMNERETAEYLHNYGVSLLCSNQREPAIQKLRASFRVTNDPSTLRMLGLAEKVQEWALTVAANDQEELKNLLDEDRLNQIRSDATSLDEARDQ